MDQAFDANKDDVREMRQRAKWHANWAVRLGIIGLVLLLPLGLEPLAAPAVALAAIVLVLASGDALDGNHRRAHQRFAVVLFLGVLAHAAWLPKMIDEGEPSTLLFVTLVGFMVVAIGSMSTVWALDDDTLASNTEEERARVRERLQSSRSIGQRHEHAGPITREELARLREESGGKGTPQATTWRGTPEHVNTKDERHPDRP